MELCQILDQSQPRVSRHLKLLTESGLVERFPDGAWVFYRLAADLEHRALVGRGPGPDRRRATPALQRDARAAARGARRALRQGLGLFRRERRRAGTSSARSTSPRPTSRPRSCAAAGQGPFQRLVDLGTGTGRMLTLLGRRAETRRRPRPVAADAQHRPRQRGRRRAEGLRAAPRRHLRHPPARPVRRPGGRPPGAALPGRPGRRGGRGRAAGGARRAAADRRLRPARARVSCARTTSTAAWASPTRRCAAGWWRRACRRRRPSRLPPKGGDGLTVKIWTAQRGANAERSAA